MPGLSAGLPTRKPDPHSGVDVRNFTGADKLSRHQQLLMKAIAESRGDFDAGAKWGEYAMLDAAREFEKATIDEYMAGTPLVEQAPAPKTPGPDPPMPARSKSTWLPATSRSSSGTPRSAFGE